MVIQSIRMSSVPVVPARHPAARGRRPGPHAAVRSQPLIRARHDAEILDVGSGTGFYLDRWRELGLERTTGSDVSDIAVERLQRRYPSLNIVQLDIGEESSAELAQRQFDIVSVFDVLFHITDDLKYHRAFENLAKLVRPGGLLVFSENFVHGESSRVAQQINS